MFNIRDEILDCILLLVPKVNCRLFMFYNQLKLLISWQSSVDGRLLHWYPTLGQSFVIPLLITNCSEFFEDFVS